MGLAQCLHDHKWECGIILPFVCQSSSIWQSKVQTSPQSRNSKARPQQNPFKIFPYHIIFNFQDVIISTCIHSSLLLYKLTIERSQMGSIMISFLFSFQNICIRRSHNSSIQSNIYLYILNLHQAFLKIIIGHLS